MTKTKKLNWEPTKSQLKYWNSLKDKKGKNAPNWRGEKASISAIHKWLNSNFGKPQKCDNPYCNGKSKRFDWSLKKDCKYEHKRKNFQRLCASCHRKYDWTAEKTLKAIKNLIWYEK